MRPVGWSGQGLLSEAREDPVSILKDFLGTVCSGCGGTKITRMSHCRACYRALPKAMQDALWKRFGEGYEAAFTESTAWLRDRQRQSSLKF
jgi:hypothetical protein